MKRKRTPSYVPVGGFIPLEQFPVGARSIPAHEPGFSVTPSGLRIPEATTMDKEREHDRKELLRQIEADLQDAQLVEMVGIVLTWAKARGIALDKLEDTLLAPYKP